MADPIGRPWPMLRDAARTMFLDSSPIPSSKLERMVDESVECAARRDRDAVQRAEDWLLYLDGWGNGADSVGSWGVALQGSLENSDESGVLMSSWDDGERAVCIPLDVEAVLTSIFNQET